MALLQFLLSSLQKHPLGSFPAADLISNPFVLSNIGIYFGDVIFGLDELVEFFIERVIKFHKINSKGKTHDYEVYLSFVAIKF